MDDDDDDIPVNCFNCTLELNQVLHIKCAECPASICVLCFQFAAESGNHKRGHNYEIIDPEKSNAACGEWGFMEAARLLKSVHQFKMGNWGEIVRSLGEDVKKAKSAKEYFDKVFIRGWMGQFAIKNADWDRIKHEMHRKGRLKELLKSESTERLLMIRDALIDKNQYIDPEDSRLMSKVQPILESYVEKCIEGKVEILWERAKVQPSQFETELASDDCDPSDEPEMKVKRPKIEADSDTDTPKQSSSSQKKTRRIMRESSSSSEEEQEKRDEEDDDQFEDAYDTAEESEDEEKASTSTAKTNGTSSVKRKRKNKTKLWSSKKSRKLTAYKHRMMRDTKKSEKELAALSSICPLDEVKELRNAFPTLTLESSNASIKKTRRPIDKDLSMLGYNVEREEFEHEWLNDAEQLISRLTITPAPPEKNQWLDIENDIKFARIQEYIRILGIRKAKRNAILEHEKLLKFFEFVREVSIGKRKAADIIGDRTEREELLQRSQQFLTKEDYNTLVDTLQEADFLTKRISKLRSLQISGDTTLKHVPPEVHRKKKLRKIDHEKNKRAKQEWAKYSKWHHNTVQDMD